MNLPYKVTLREVSTRDGFQSLSVFIPTQVKIQIVSKIIESGIKEIEVTSFVSSKFVPQLRDAYSLISFLIKHKKNNIYSALVPNFKGAKDAIEAGIDKIVIVISASEAHNKANLNKSISSSLSEFKDLFELAKAFSIPVVGSIAVAFGCPYEGVIKISEVLNLCNIYLSLGADSVILADTIGVATPSCIIKMINSFKNQFSEKDLIMHFHNNNGAAMANLLAAMDSGVTSFDTSLGGIGGCPYVPSAAGNLATEDVVRMLEIMKIHTGINLKKIKRASLFLKEKIV